MSLLDLSNLTLNAREAESVAEAIFEVLITGGQLADSHEIETGITMKQQIPFVGNFGLIGKKAADCDRNNHAGKLPLTEKFWDPEYFAERFKHCARDVNTLLKIFKKAKRVNPDFYDRVGSEELGVIVSRIESALQLMLNRIVWFSGKTKDTISQGGVLTDGTDIEYFNVIDGLFEQMFTEIPTSAANYVAIAKNQEATYALQDALNASDGLMTLRKMYNKMDARFYAAVQNGAMPKFYITRELYQNYEDYLEDESIAFTLKETQDGVSKKTYRGIEIEVRHDWDAIIREYENNGTKYNLPHRCVLTLKENIPVGTTDTESLTGIKSWYRDFDHSNYMDVDFNIDTKHLLAYMTVFAY